MLAVKKALEEASGDEEKAIEILRKRGEAQVVKKATRDQAEGCVFLAQESGKAALVRIACETDFVAKGDDFQNAGRDFASKALSEGVDSAKTHAESVMPDLVNKLGENISLAETKVVEGSPLGTYVHTNSKIGVIITLDGGDETKARDVAMHAAAMAPEFINPEDVSADAVDKEREIWKEQLTKDGKPAEIQEKIMMGKEKKFREESALMKQPFAKDPSITVEKYLNGAKVVEYVRMAV